MPRWFAGLHLTSDCRRIETALVGVHGRGDGAPIECRQSMAFDLPAEIAENYQQFLANEQSSSSLKLSSRLAALSEELAGVEEEALDELLAESRIPKSELLAVGLLDPGWWCIGERSRMYRPLSCPDVLAQRTGISVIDSFPSRDIACGGTGGPLLPFPAWIVLCSEEKDRVLIDLGKTARLTFLPSSKQPMAHQRIEFKEICPCGSLLDELTIQLTRGKSAVDSGGHLTVQGKHIPTLLNRWNELSKKILLNNGGTARSKSVWTPNGISPKLLIQFALEQATRENWAIRDILCTAAYFIAESITREVESRYAKSKSETEILLTGGGCGHGLLLNRLGKNLSGWTQKSIKECGVAVDSFDAVCVAILTLFFADQIPAAIPGITGAQTTRPLGRMTPGSPQNWAAILDEILQAKARSL
ncbi:MAG: anhydro-N-acetylmuramic acid kinase [Planctomycetaceae bacterium]|nr:anhydro-N-acetylmuramic acid kinase [Planctomycetaceae bacterium]